MKKLKVGFGPATTANSFHQSGVKVAARLNEDPEFEASTFGPEFNLGELSAFDILVFIKILPDLKTLQDLKRSGKILILDYQDMFLTPSAHEPNPIKRALKRVRYFGLESTERRRLSCIDLCLVASEEAQRVAQRAGLKTRYLFRQIYNDWNEKNKKVHTKKTSNLRIIWTGTPWHLYLNEEIEPTLKKICGRYHCKVVYLTDKDPWNNEWLIHKKWTLENWEKDLLDGDIAFRWRDESNDQRHKDSNKIISYMAAGLPVVCKPTTSDLGVIDDGSTGLFSWTPIEFKEKIEKLILNPGLRKSIGDLAHATVWSKYNLSNHVVEIKKIFKDLEKNYE